MIERRTPIKRTPLKARRKPIPKVGRKRQRELAALHAWSAALIDRSHGWCEAANLVDLTGQRICGRIGRHEGTDPHHLWPEDRDRGMHAVHRGRWLCRAAHDWAHVVASPTESNALGLLRPPELLILVDRMPTELEAQVIAARWYPSHPDCASVRIEWPLGRCVVSPPGDAVEWWT